VVDELLTIKTILTDGWDSDNTDSITPTIDEIFDQKELDLANNDYVLLYSTPKIIKPFNIGGTTFEHTSPVSIDIRTTYQSATMGNVRAHAIKVRDEVERLLKANLSNPDGNFQLLIPLRCVDLSDKRIGIGRFIFDCHLINWGT